MPGRRALTRRLRRHPLPLAGEGRSLAHLGPFPASKAASRRRGITLLEVLVSIFILLFGLLAVAAMIPVAGLRIIQTNQADNSAACGQAALRDVKVRRMLEPRQWLIYWFGPGPKNPNGFVPAARPGPNGLGIPFFDSYAIDPLGFARNPGVGAFARFPYSGLGLTMTRVTLDVNLAPNNTSKPATYVDMPADLADRIFTWHDDLAIPIPSDPAARPRAIINNGVVQIQGDYSWLVTVTPQVDAPDFQTASGKAMHYIDEHRTYSVSIVVFYKRDFSPPGAAANSDVLGERVARAYMYGGGVAGGDVQLVTFTTEEQDLNGNGTLDSIGPQYLDVDEGRWLMLSGTKAGRPVFHWYRVVRAGETFLGNEDDDAEGDGDGNLDADEDLDNDCHLDVNEDVNGNGVLDPGEDVDGDGKLDTKDEDVDGDGKLDCGEDLNGNGIIDPLWVREVTLAGPDRNAAFCVCIPRAYATLFTGVIGVYTSTVELDERGSLFAN